MMMTLGILVGTLVLGLIGLSLFLTLSPPPRSPTSKEQSFVDVLTGRRVAFTSLTNAPEYTLTVVVPAYNETQRLGHMLDECIAHLEKKNALDPNFTFEILVVDDGSSDETTKCARNYGKSWLKSKTKDEKSARSFKVMTFEKNRGKGGAVTRGIMAASGSLILFADADGASKFSEFDKLEKALKQRPGVAIGSRAHMVDTEAVVKRSFLRNFLMRSFHFVLYIFGIASIGDTQCGFKCFTRSAAKAIFPNMHVEGWIFDIEVLLLAGFLKIPITEIPIDWHEVDGTKMVLARDSLLMLKDLIRIRLCYFTRLWRFQKEI